MPINYIRVNGVKGFRYGTTGAFYSEQKYGKEGAREKAVKQSQAIHASKNRAIQIKATRRARGYERRL